MKAKIIKRFKDRYTKSILEVGQILEIDNERFKEINSTVHGILAEEIKEEKEPPIEQEEKEDKKKATKK